MRYSGLGVRSVGPVGNFLEFGIFSWSNLWKMSFKSTIKKTFKGPMARKITCKFLDFFYKKDTKNKNGYEKSWKSQRQDSPSCLPLQSVLSLKKNNICFTGNLLFTPQREKEFHRESQHTNLPGFCVAPVFFKNGEKKLVTHQIGSIFPK